MTRDAAWLAELVHLGGRIHQDDDEPLTEADDARHQAEVARYLEMLDSICHDPAALADAVVAESVLRSVHPIDDYGIYGSAYRTLEAFDPDVLAPRAAAIMPELLARHGGHPSVEGAFARIVADEALAARLASEVDRWDEGQRAVVVPVVEAWAREDEAWDEVLLALGRALSTPGADPVPAGWPEDWRDAALAFRESGRVDPAWRDERDFASNFDRVLALMELGHGPRWRDVPNLLNPLLVRRRAAVPAFVRALRALSDERRARVLAAVARARPATADWLCHELDALDP